MSWFWSKDQGVRAFQNAKKNEEKPWDNVEDVANDPRIGKRVFYLPLLPEFAVYGPIQRITRYSNKDEYPSHAMEYWYVLTDQEMGIEAPSQCFERYEYPTEFQAGDRVRHRVDEGGYWEGVVRGPVLAIDELRFLIRIENVQTKVKIQSGSEAAYPPGWLIKI